jgi:ferredoxin
MTIQIEVLSSWKDIAKYAGKGVRTVQRWCQEIGSCSTTRGTLRQPIQTQQELSEATQKLSEQIRRAADQCDLLIKCTRY